eukprot:6191526-Pleurochrysis_carterae.AAC.2
MPVFVCPTAHLLAGDNPNQKPKHLLKNDPASHPIVSSVSSLHPTSAAPAPANSARRIACAHDSAGHKPSS